MAIWRYTTAAPDLSGYALQAQVTSIAATSATTAAQLAALIASNNAASSNGKSYTFLFTQDSDRSNNFNPGFLDIIRWNGVGMEIPFANPFVSNQQYSAHEILKQPLSTDAQSVVAVISEKLTTNAATILVLGAKADMSSALLGLFFADHVELRLLTYNPATGVYSTGPAALNQAYGLGTPPAGSTIELRRSGTLNNFYSFIINGTTVGSYSDTAFNNIGPLYRYCGWMAQYISGLIGFAISAGVSYWGCSDIAVPSVLGTGWEIFRANATNPGINFGATGNQQCVPNTFDTVKRLSKVTNPSNNGQINITDPGFYTMELRLHMSAAVGTGVVCPLVYSNLDASGAVNGTTMRVNSAGQDVTGTQVFDTYGAFGIYCPAGTILIPGVNLPGSRTVIGDSTGYITYWNGQKASP